MDLKRVILYLFSLSSVLLTGVACRRSKESNSIIISGKLNESLKLKDGELLYLFDAANKGLIKDSATIKNGMFQFILKEDTALVPFKAKICYWDFNSNEGLLKQLQRDSVLKFLRPIGFYNPYDSNSIESYFYLNYGANEIIPFKGRGALHQIQENGQNEPFFRHKVLSVFKDSNYVGEQIISHNAELISEYYQSFFLLNQLFRIKEFFRIKDLKYLISLFDNKLNAESVFSPYLSYVSSVNTTKNILSNLRLENENQVRSKVLLHKKENTFLIFWASWCLPCRAEVPLLKKLYFQNKDLEMISVSIDDNYEHWKQALEKENMPWSQYIVRKEDKAVIDLIFKIHSIPLLCLIDRNNNIKQTINGFSDSTFKVIVNAIATNSSK